MLSSIQQQQIIHTLGSQDGQTLISKLNDINGIKNTKVAANRQIYCLIDPTTLNMKSCLSRLKFETKSHKFSPLASSDPKIFCITAKLKNVAPFFSAMSLNDERAFFIDDSSSDDSSIYEAPLALAPKQKPYSLEISFETQFHAASPTEITTQGHIESLKPGLLTGHIVDKNNQVIYFARESLNQNNPTLNQWHHIYGEISSLSADLEDLLSAPTQIPTSMSPLLKDYNLKAVTDEVKNASQWSTLDQLAYAIGRVTYASQGQLLANADYRQEPKHILYASTQPVTDFLFRNTDLISTLDEFMNKTNHIAVMVSTSSNKDRIIHRGIVKPPASMITALNADFRHKGFPTGGLSMALHAFGMQCAYKNGIEYMTISPMKKMFDIFTASNMYKSTKSILTGKDQISRKKLTHLVGPTCSNDSAKKNEVQMLIKLKDVKNPLWV